VRGSIGSSGLVIVFETHSTSVDNEAGIASGWHDAILSATGEQQARDLGERRRDDDLAAVFSSDLARAVRTAEIAFGARGIPLVRDRRLRECHYGTLTRYPAAEIEAHRVEHISTPYPHGESLEQVAQRVASWLKHTAAEFRGKTIAVVGHRATHYALEHLIAGTPLADIVAAPWCWQPGWVYKA
jgi:broad specificity phosphatase PhoE